MAARTYFDTSADKLDDSSVEPTMSVNNTVTFSVVIEPPSPPAPLYRKPKARQPHGAIVHPPHGIVLLYQQRTIIGDAGCSPGHGLATADFADNLPVAQDKITAAWTFAGTWDPESAKGPTIVSVDRKLNQAAITAGSSCDQGAGVRCAARQSSQSSVK